MVLALGSLRAALKDLKQLGIPLSSDRRTTALVIPTATNKDEIGKVSVKTEVTVHHGTYGCF